MTFKDVLMMSLGNLFRRKLRTILTILGVLIGTASIVAMLSIALGMKKMMLSEFEQYGGATEIQVYEGGGMDDGNSSDDTKLTDTNMKAFEALDHVKKVTPQLSVDVNMKSGKYEAYITVLGVDETKLKDITLAKGTCPSSKDGSVLEAIVGNIVLNNFYYQNGDNMVGYYSNGELPNIDLLHSSVMTTLQNENAEESDVSQSTAMDTEDTNDDTKQSNSDSGMSSDMTDNTTVPVRLKMLGLMEGGPDDYNENSECLLVNIDNLKAYLTKNFKKGCIPGQPKNSKGQPFKDWVYNSCVVTVDSSDAVDSVMQNIQDMGFSANSNKELLDSVNKTTKIVELVFGGIGMIAFLVAAIGIANTMMMSTYERTKEIGVMKVLGCDMRDIQKLFLSEAGFIGFLGGVFGVLLTIIMSVIANSLTAKMIAEEMNVTDAKISVIPLWLILVGIGFATLMGMVAGYFPARRAMKLSPLAAIHTE